jgi:hypothetical protein
MLPTIRRAVARFISEMAYVIAEGSYEGNRAFGRGHRLEQLTHQSDQLGFGEFIAEMA